MESLKPVMHNCKNKLEVLIVYDGHPLPDNRIKTLSSWQKSTSKTKVMFTLNSTYKRTILDKVFYKLGYANDPCNVNRKIINYSKIRKPDIVFFVRPVNIKSSTLKHLKRSGIKTISWSNDDMFGKHNRSFQFSQSIPYYDLIVTQKSYNCNPEELPSLGAKNILFQNKAFDPSMHHPVSPEKHETFRHDIVFVGTFEKERYKTLNYLAENNLKIHIYGWSKSMGYHHPNLIFHNKHLYGEDYAAVFSSSKICLNFLRKLNRDLQTSRSIEIPACKGFMLAERTDEHLRLFKESEEAEFFSSDKELLDKIYFYLSNEERRIQIAENGYERCIKDQNHFDNRIEEIINRVLTHK